MNRESLVETNEASVCGSPGPIPIELVLDKFALFLKGCGYNFDKLHANKNLIE